jgi:hypothetical protein
MNIDGKITAAALAGAGRRVLELGAEKVRLIDRTWDASRGTPVFTVGGQYTTRGWTEWTQGFLYGCALLGFDGTGQADLLEMGREKIVAHMGSHITHVGVHDHAFNNLSTYGSLRRLMREGKIASDDWELRFYELAIKASGAVQAARWAGVAVAKPSPLSANSTGLGYIYSFNGPHSLFVDAMRTCRILGLSWQLGGVLMHENDRKADLLKRSVLHGLCTNQFIVCHGASGQTYDVRGRTSHEGIFNRSDGSFRCRSTQQGYSPFSTWTRGLAWAMLGFAEELEFFATIDEKAFAGAVGLARADVIAAYEGAARATCDHYIDQCACADGVVYWDDGAPGLAKMGDWRSRAADPFNEHEPVDSSAAAIAAQGLLRLGRYIDSHGGSGGAGQRYYRAGLTIARALMGEPYLSTSTEHQGLLLHTVYHRPNGWDHVPSGRKVPCGESGLWGDYHLMELAVYLQRAGEESGGGNKAGSARPTGAARGSYLTFFDAPGRVGG